MRFGYFGCIKTNARNNLRILGFEPDEVAQNKF